ncbi:unnamed protein product, partial [Staurois parvus]
MYRDNTIYTMDRDKHHMREPWDQQWRDNPCRYGDNDSNHHHIYTIDRDHTVSHGR